MNNWSLPKLKDFPASIQEVVRIELKEGVLIFRASATVQTRIEKLLAKQQESNISLEEEQELDCYK